MLIWIFLFANLTTSRKRKNHSKFHKSLLKFVHKLERQERKILESTNSENSYNDLSSIMSSMSTPITEQIRSAYAPGFGPETLHVDPPDQDLPTIDLTDTGKFPGAGSQYPAAVINAPTFCCSCKKDQKSKSKGTASAFPS